MTITVIYPADRRFEEGAKAFEYTGPVFHNNTAQTLEYIFRQCNHVDGTEWIAGKPYRSMSVGDLVIITDSWEEGTWEVAGTGWNKLI